jgi:hypothetical protein
MKENFGMSVLGVSRCSRIRWSECKVYTCANSACGCTFDRDVNAAKNMLVKGIISLQWAWDPPVAFLAGKKSWSIFTRAYQGFRNGGVWKCETDPQGISRDHTAIEFFTRKLILVFFVVVSRARVARVGQHSTHPALSRGLEGGSRKPRPYLAVSG